MATPDRPQPRSRSKATPAVDEAAGATPIAPAHTAPTPARLTSRTATAPAWPPRNGSCTPRPATRTAPMESATPYPPCNGSAKPRGTRASPTPES